MNFLIVKCDVCTGQQECDADRTPMFITNDWINNQPEEYDFEVYEILQDNTLKCIREYEEGWE